METDVQTIFNEIAEGSSVSGQHSHLLFGQFKENHKIFQEQLEGCYLKIVKFYAQMNKKHRKLYEDVTERIFNHFFKMYEKSRQENIITLCRYFLQLFSEGIESSAFLTRVCMSRQLFMLLRAVPPALLNTVVDDVLAQEMISATVGLFRSGKGIQSKTERVLAIKLSAYLQYLQFPGRSSKFKQCWDVLNSEMIKSVCEEDTSRLRLDALTNIELRPDTFNCIVSRIRDKDVGIRQQVVKKLMKSKILFEEMSIGDRYQLIHDGLKNSSPEVRQQFQSLILIQFCIIREQEEGNVKEQTEMIDEENKRQSTIRKRVSLSTNEFQKEVSLMRRTFKRFIGMLQVERTLIYPQIHDVVVEATRSIIRGYKQTSEIAVYLKDLFEQMSKLQSITPDELFLIRVVITSLRTELDDTLFETIDSHFLDGCQLADYIQSTEFTSLYKISELVRLAGVQINTDQKGRVQLQEVLKGLLLNQENFKALKPQNNEASNDVYEQLSENEIKSRWYGQHHFETPVIYDFTSFIPFIVKTINRLFGSDVQGFAQFIFETVYHDIRQKHMNTCENLLSEKRSTEVKLKVRDQEILKKNNEMIEIKKKKGLQRQLELLELEQKESQQEKNSLNEKLTQINYKIHQIDTQSLAVLDGLFATVDIHLCAEPFMQKLIETVMTLNKFYNEESESKIPKLLAFKCLAYLPLFSKEQSRNLIGIFQKIIKQAIDDNPTEQIAGDDPLYIISLRSLLDYLLLYPFEKEEDIEHVNMITALAFKSTGVLQCTALEGLAKLLLHQRIPDSKVYIAALLFIWLDKLTKMNYMQLHIITTFFRCLITSNLELLLDFEKGFEVYTCVCCFLMAKTTYKLNTNYLHSGHWQETSILNNAIIGMNMIRFETIKDHESLTKLKEKMNHTQQTQDDYFLGPQEEYLLFLCKMVKDYGNTILRPLISPAYFDFFETYDLEEEIQGKIVIESVIYEIILTQLKKTITFLEDKGKNTDLEIQLQQKLELALGDRDNTEEAKQITNKIEQCFEEQKKYTNQLVNFFKDQFIIVEDTTKSRDKDLNDIVQSKVIQYSNDNNEEESEEDNSQKLKEKRERISDNESYDVHNKGDDDDDESEEISIPTKGKKKAIQKKRPKGKK